MPTVGPQSFPQPNDRKPDGVVVRRITRFPRQPEAQLKSNWCWAAVCQTIVAGYGNKLTQVEVVHQCHPGHESDNDPYYPASALEDLGAEIKDLDQAMLAKEVPQYCETQEVAIDISWTDGSNIGHAICALGTGTVDGKSALLIYDPQSPRAGTTGMDLIKLVPIAVLAGHYLERASEKKRGKWVSAVRVANFEAR